MLPPSATYIEERPPLEAYWVEPGWFMVGEAMNGWLEDLIEKPLAWLAAQGIRQVIYLADAEPDEMDEPYEKVFEACAQRLGVQVDCQRIFRLPGMKPTEWTGQS